MRNLDYFKKIMGFRSLLFLIIIFSLIATTEALAKTTTDLDPTETTLNPSSSTITSSTDTGSSTDSDNPTPTTSTVDGIDFQSRMMTVGGILEPTDTTALLVAGAQTNVAWMIPVIVSGIGIGIVIARKF